MAIKSLQVFHVGSTFTDKTLMTFMRGQGTRIESPFFSYLLKTDEGNIVIDTGLHPEDAEASYKMAGLEFDWKEEDYLPNQLKAAGVAMEDVSTIIMTHLHPDHVGWMKAFPNAEIVCQKWERALNAQPPGPGGPILQRYSDLDKLKWKLVDGDTVLMPGISLIFTPGHTQGHQSIMLDMPQSGTIILTGDATFLEENYKTECIPCPFYNAREAYVSIRKLNFIASLKNATMFPGHDIAYYQANIKKSPEVYT